MPCFCCEKYRYCNKERANQLMQSQSAEYDDYDEEYNDEEDEEEDDED